MNKGVFENVAAIILAAGLGTRMKSDKAKVLHELLGKPMVSYVVETATQVVGQDIILVVGNQAETVKAVFSDKNKIGYAYQEKQLGTGHAVQCALPHVPDYINDVVILCGDVPLITSKTISDLVRDHREQYHDLSVLAVEIENPRGYGRIVFDQEKRVCGIVEESDASPEQKQIKMINTGIFCVKTDFLASALPRLRPDNAQGEIYLTDILAIGYRDQKKIGVMVGSSPTEVIGINTIEELAQVETMMRNRLRNIT